MSMDAELAHIRKMDGLLIRAQQSNDPVDWERYFDAIREADETFGLRPERTAHERTGAA